MGGDMSFQAPPRFAALLLVLILPEREKETLRGDLVEEYNLVVASLGERRARRWYWKQMARSVAPLLWASFRRGDWLKTLGAVTAGYVIVVTLVATGEYALSEIFPAPTRLYAVISLLIGFPVMFVAGYFVARIRSRAVSSFAVFVTLMGLLSLAVTGDAAPLWYQISLVLVGPTAALLGARLFIKNNQTRSNGSSGNFDQENSGRQSNRENMD